MSKQGDLHIKWQRVFKDAHPELSSAEAQRRANDEWKQKKSSSKSFEDLEKAINERVAECKALTMKKRSAYGLFFSKAATAKSTNESRPSGSFADPAPPGPSHLPSTSCGEDPNEDPDDPIDPSSPAESMTYADVLKRRYKTPAQDRTEIELKALRAQRDALVTARDAGLDDESGNTLKKLKKTIKVKEQSLKTSKKNAKYQQKFRQTRKEAMQKLVAATPGGQQIVKLRKEPGRRRFEKDDLLLETIVDLVLLKSAADERRRTEMIRTYRTLDDLHSAIKEKGFEISRSGLYLRLLPRNSLTAEGKRHYKTAPVKLCRAQTDEHKSHPDGRFCTSTIRNAEALASLLGPHQVVFLSQDDKAKVPIGMTAANKQAPLMMHLEYRVRLPDHDWVIAPKHKLTPSVYSAMIIKENGLGTPDAVTYSGPTYVAIRSLKHSASNANTHSEDFKNIMDLEIFKPLVRTAQGEVKPVVIISADGGPDENPRYPKVISFAIQHFQEYDLDALIVMTNAPGRSAFNRIERRMAPLSAQLAGLILPAYTYGSHLNDKGETVDKELELKNFTAAGEALAEVWSSLVIDGHGLVAEFKQPGKEPALPPPCDPIWYSIHVRESQYALQIVKCRNPACCKPMRSDFLHLLPDRFLPPPCPLRQTQSGLIIPEPTEARNTDPFLPLFLRLNIRIPIALPPELKKVPYDMYCSTLSMEDFVKRSCRTCGLYFASKKAVDLHSRGVHGTKSQGALPKLRPVRVSGRRGKELLCLFRDEQSGAEDVEWQDEEDVDTRGLDTNPATPNAPSEIHQPKEWAMNEFTVQEEDE